MARRELSSTLKNLKFMQRAAVREEKTKREEDIKPDVSIITTPTTVTRKCVVIMEGDPHPGALKGRMSFQSFNPSVDKLNEEEARLRQPAAETTVSRNQNASVSVRSPSRNGIQNSPFPSLQKPLPILSHHKIFVIFLLHHLFRIIHQLRIKSNLFEPSSQVPNLPLLVSLRSLNSLCTLTRYNIDGIPSKQPFLKHQPLRIFTWHINLKHIKQ
ncbi:hypothetical protein VIGAN_07048800 [Vigna angularis var. angularis]|uniref:M-phase phosphoprotein 6 n=1 Tax=Vigna angularis var. angularis TaxID=157739 RepID=A0A0S3SGD0_PHAAN|nr:hypothetical protein VIGAN_07048800 [Vigna angularis var. angularis]